jgi:hypothetical protein
MLDPLDEESLDEVFTFRRMAQIAFGRFQSFRFPAGHIALDRTWHIHRGLTDVSISISQEVTQPRP